MNHTSIVGMSVLLSKQSVNPNEALLYFAGWGYVVVAILYSAFVFFGRFLDRWTGAGQTWTGFVNWSGYLIPPFSTQRPPSQVFSHSLCVSRGLALLHTNNGTLSPIASTLVNKLI